jgi:hypothetical protein
MENFIKKRKSDERRICNESGRIKFTKKRKTLKR